MFLTPQQLTELTGRKRPIDQIKWLTGKYAFEIGADGKPKVLKAAVHAKLGAPLNEQPDTPKLHLS